LFQPNPRWKAPKSAYFMDNFIVMIFFNDIQSKDYELSTTSLSIWSFECYLLSQISLQDMTIDFKRFDLLLKF
jgi:hypothetical protein